MSKIILSALILSTSTSALAYQVNLADRQVVSVEELVSTQATHVTCENQTTRCVLRGREFGIQYPGQTYDSIEFSRVYSAEDAVEQVIKLKEMDLCE